MHIRRKFHIEFSAMPPSPTWWWVTRFGRLEAVSCALIPKTGGAPVAVADCYGLDLYTQKWGQRAAGIANVLVAEQDRRKGYAQTLLVEICRHMKDGLVSLVEIHTEETNPAGLGLLESLRFRRVDTGVVYRRRRDAMLPGE